MLSDKSEIHENNVERVCTVPTVFRQRFIYEKELMIFLNSPIPRVAAIHDLSGFGRCALTCVIPVLSAMGIQCVPMPTAVLSTHTGGYKKFSITDMTEQMISSTAHWNELGLHFDAVYSGFLGSAEQIEVVEKFLDIFHTGNTIALIDPVMGDDGEPYQTVTPSHRENMKRLAVRADILTPNVTEAFFLLEREYTEPDDNMIIEMMHSLTAKYCKKIVITGIHGAKIGRISDCTFPEYVSTASLDVSEKSNAEVVFCRRPAIPRGYPGTGDIFSSVMLGRLISGKILSEAAEDASEFVYQTIKFTAQYDTPSREGVMLEAMLSKLMQS